MRNLRLARLVRALGDPDEAVRMTALDTLSKGALDRLRISGRQRRRALAALARRARDEPVDWIRAFAVGGLGWNAGWSGTTRVLVDVATSDPDPNVRGHALESLTLGWTWARQDVPSFRPVDRAIRDALASPEAVLRFWAVYAVGQLELQEHRAALEALVDDPDIGFADLTVGHEARQMLRRLNGETHDDDDLDD